MKRLMHDVLDLPGEPGIPLGDLWIVRPVAHLMPVPLLAPAQTWPAGRA